jgi:hypothetical protein
MLAVGGPPRTQTAAHMSGAVMAGTEELETETEMEEEEESITGAEME